VQKTRDVAGNARIAEAQRAAPRWTPSRPEHWKSAVENYVARVRRGNTVPLGAAIMPFARYLNSMHQRIHPIFADAFLGSLDARSASEPSNSRTWVVGLEIVLTREGEIEQMGVVKTSGQTDFDIGALDSVERASPFGAPPAEILSPDGRIYIHWLFHRDILACTTMNVYPFMLAPPPATHRE